MQLTVGAKGKPPRASFYSLKGAALPNLWLGAWCTRSNPAHEYTVPRPLRALQTRRPSSSRCLAAPNLIAEARTGPSGYHQAAQQRQAVLQGDGCQQSGQVLGPKGSPRGARKASRSQQEGQKTSALDKRLTRRAKSAPGEVQQAKSALGQSAQRLSKVGTFSIASHMCASS